MNLSTWWNHGESYPKKVILKRKLTKILHDSAQEKVLWLGFAGPSRPEGTEVTVRMDFSHIQIYPDHKHIINPPHMRENGTDSIIWLLGVWGVLIRERDWHWIPRYSTNLKPLPSRIGKHDTLKSEFKCYDALCYVNDIEYQSWNALPKDGGCFEECRCCK